MSHANTRTQLIQLANSTAGQPNDFLDGLSPIHDAWHTRPRTYGFLLFHSRLVRYYQSIVNPTLSPHVVPFTAADFTSMSVSPFTRPTAGVDSLAELAAFSNALESWHNTAHGAIGMATGAPMMDARVNIYFRPFWQLHIFIDDLFKVILKQYAATAHSGQFLNPVAVAGHLEASHHSWVVRI